MKKNCWEIKKCGREPNGAKVGDLGVCPASITKELNSTNGGIKAGRSCWIVAGTLCGGLIQGSFAQKYNNCSKCEFYSQVQQEEGEDYQDSSELALIMMVFQIAKNFISILKKHNKCAIKEK